MTSLQRVACLIGSAAALLLSASGCDPYTYFNVQVTIDSVIDKDTQNYPRRQINACVVYVFAGDTQIEQGRDLKQLNGTEACRAPDTPLEVGTMDYSTARSSGSVKFIVNMKDLSDAVTVQGSVQADVNPGQVLTVKLLAEPCTTTPCQDTSGFK